MSTRNKGFIQILRGSNNFDPSVREDSLLDGQPFYSKKTKQLFIGESNKSVKDLHAINDPHMITFTEDILTSYSMGSVLASPTSRVPLFKAGSTLQDVLNTIFDPTLLPSVEQPTITLTLLPPEGEGELGASWPTIYTDVDTLPGSYTYGPYTNVQWNNNNVTYYGNALGIFGDGDRTYTVTRQYTEGEEALDNKGQQSSPLVQISAGEGTDSKAFIETVLYRQFYCSTLENNIGAILLSLKSIINNKPDGTVKTYLLNYNPESVLVYLPQDGFIYFITANTINGATMSGFEFPIVDLGKHTFNNYYNKSYDVNVYRSALEQTTGTYNIVLN